MNNGSTLSNNSTHSRDQTMFKNKDKALRLFNELIKLKLLMVFKFGRYDQMVYIYEMTRLGITYVSVKCKPLQGVCY